MVKGNRAMRRGGPVRAGVVLLGTALALSACSSSGEDGGAAAPAVATQDAAGQDVAAPKATGTPAPAESTQGEVRGHSVKGVATLLPAPVDERLLPFLTEAERLDARLRRAASLVNAGMTENELRIRPETVAAIKATGPEKLAATVPAGMPPELMRAVLLTYSDLVSRHGALSVVADAGDSKRTVIRRGDTHWPTLGDVVEILGNGSPAAKRFPGDLAAARTLGTKHTVAKVGPRTRAAAEIRLRVDDINLNNACCMSYGGAVYPELAPVRWTGGRDGRSWTGTIRTIEFLVAWTGRQWQVELSAG